MDSREGLHNGNDSREYCRKKMLYRKGSTGNAWISRPTVYELLKKNEFRWIQIGNKYRISKKSFDEWLDQKSETI